jgi:hypothetical protein
MPEHEDRFHFENPSDRENEMTLYATVGGGVYVTVAEEQAFDSYNSTVNTSIAIPERAAKALRDYLLAKFPL